MVIFKEGDEVYAVNDGHNGLPNNTGKREENIVKIVNESNKSSASGLLDNYDFVVLASNGYRRVNSITAKFRLVKSKSPLETIELW